MWEDRLKELLEFREAHGHVDVPRHWPHNPSLAHWVVNQRRLVRLGKLPASRLGSLESQGVRWLTSDERRWSRDREWSRMCDALLAYHRAHGHADVPGNGSANPVLARWVVRQRHLLRSGQMRKDRRLRLEHLGIEIPLDRGRSRNRDRAWDRMFKRLAEYRRAIGGCDVPKNWTDNPTLGRWVARQRSLLRHGTMRPDRCIRLRELGLQIEKPSAVPVRRGPVRWGDSRRQQEAWRRQFDQLVAFRSVHGHTDVPRRWPDDPRLARWVCLQREKRRRARLAGDRINLLDGLAFHWTGSDLLQRERSSSWEQMCRRLAEYRLAHGDCNVPARWSDDPSLGRWVTFQRVLQRRGKLKSERFRFLSRMAFHWNGARARRSPAAR
ncbi:MAG TPA: helicase associated domain-containing protein [Planctomycetota bacterium]|nr:helicase associated domain-containing protein [Planctomycetota bacterium]